MPRLTQSLPGPLPSSLRVLNFWPDKLGEPQAAEMGGHHADDDQGEQPARDHHFGDGKTEPPALATLGHKEMVDFRLHWFGPR